MSAHLIATILGGIAVAAFVLAVIGIRMRDRQLEPDNFRGDQWLDPEEHQ